MIISNNYLKSLAGFKITLLESNLTEFKLLKTKHIGKIVGVTPDNQLKVYWYTKNHPNYTIDITEDKFIIYGNKTEKKRRKRSKKKPKVETN